MVPTIDCPHQWHARIRELGQSHSSINHSMLSPALVLVCLYMGLVDRRYSRIARLRIRRRQTPGLQDFISAVGHLVYQISSDHAGSLLTPCVKPPRTLQICLFSWIYPTVTYYCEQNDGKAPTQEGEFVHDLSPFTDYGRNGFGEECL